MSSAQSEASQSMPRLDDLNSQEKLTKDIPPTADLEKQEPITEQDPIKPDTDDNGVPTITGIKWVLLCAALYISAFLYGLDTTIAADVQGPVVETFGQVEQLSWLGTGFPLGSVAVILVLGALYGLFDQKYLYIASIVLFEAGSILCGAAPTMNALIVGRVIAGIGGSGMYLACINFLSSLTSASNRGTYISGIGVCWGLGTILGPVIGGAFSDSAATWRWAFYINAPLGAVFAPVYLWCVPSLTFGKGTVSERLRSIDWIGFVLSAGLWAFFTVLFTVAGTTWAWNDGRTIAFFVLFGVLLIAFIAQQLLMKGLLPVYLLKSRDQILLYIVTSCCAAAMFVPLYFLPIFFQFVDGDTALLAAVRILPFIVVFAFVNMVAGFFLSKVGYYMIYYLVAGVTILAGGAALFTVTPDTPTNNIYGYSVLIAFGSGIAGQAGYTVATVKAVKISSQAMVDAISLQNFSQIGSIVIALVMSGQIFQSLAFQRLSGVLVGYPEEAVRSAVAGSSSPVFAQLSEETRRQAVAAIVSAMSDVYALVIVAGGILIVASVLMKFERLG